MTTALSSFEPLTLAVLIVGLVLAAYIRGFTGFGLSALFVAIGALVVEPRIVVPIAVLLEIAGSIIQAREVWSHIDWKRVALICGGAILGNPIGVAILSWVPGIWLSLGISIFILLASLALLAGWQFSRKAGSAGTAGVGFFSGIVNGASSLGGLPIVLFMAADGASAATLRASIIAYLFITDIYATGLMTYSGVMELSTVTLALLSVPILALGIWVGGRRFSTATPESFRRFTLRLLIGLSLFGIGRAIFF